MRTIALNVMQESIEIAYSTNNNEPPFRQFMITYNPDQAIGNNLEKKSRSFWLVCPLMPPF